SRRWQRARPPRRRCATGPGATPRSAPRRGPSGRREVNAVEVLVIGGGVSGLACGVRLAEAGLAVRLLARERPERTVSAVAAALWHPFKAEPPEQIARWSRVSYDVYRRQAGDPATGVVMRPLLELFPEPVPLPLSPEAVPHFRPAPPPPGYGDPLPRAVPRRSAPRTLRPPG